MRIWWMAFLLVGCISTPGIQVVPVADDPIVLLAMVNDTDANITFEIGIREGNTTYPLATKEVPARQSTTQVFRLDEGEIAVGVALIGANQTTDSSEGQGEARGFVGGDPAYEVGVNLTGWPRVAYQYDARLCGEFPGMRYIVRASDGPQLAGAGEACIDLRT